MSEFYENFLKTFAREYPKTAAQADLRKRISPQLICPEIMKFPKIWLTQAQEIVHAFGAVRDLRDRQARLQHLSPEIPDPHHHSVLMSYDFHVDENNQLRLIEINTNASMALITDISYKTLGYDNGLSTDFQAEIVKTFIEDYQEFAGAEADTVTEKSSSPQKKSVREAKKMRPQNVALVDEKPLEQRLYVEFEMYRELFEKNGMPTQIVDPSELKFRDGSLWLQDQKVDLVYNRDTDFHLTETRSVDLKQARDAGVVCVTPSAFEYRLLADKERLEELSQTSAIESLPVSVSEKACLSRALIRTQAISEFTESNALWTDRKKYFFKPRRSFGGKAVYRGSSVSRGTFQKILTGDYLVQDFVPPKTVTIPVHSPPEDIPKSGVTEDQVFKFDLRFYVYRDRVQLSCARLYQGQMTNSQTPGGGVAAIDWLP